MYKVAFFTLAFCLFACSQKPSKNISTKPLKKKSSRPWVLGPQKINQTYFVDATKEYGLENQQATHIYAVDFNNDSFVDIVTLPEHYSIPRFFRFDPEKNKYMQIDLPFKKVVRASYLLFYDFNRDNVLDIVLGTLNQKTELERYPLRFFQGKLTNNSISFHPVNTGKHWKALPTAGVSVTDFDLDGNLDLYLANWLDVTGVRPTAVPDTLYQGNGFTFKNVSASFDKEHFRSEEDIYINARPSYGVSSCDIDLNGHPDFLVMNTHGHANKLWMHLKKPLKNGVLFEDWGKHSRFGMDQIGLLQERGGGHTLSSVCADYNNDGIMDIFVGELFRPFDNESVDRSSLLTGKEIKFPPQFYRTDYSNFDPKSTGQGDRRASWVDLNFDGLLDLVVDNSGFPPTSRLVMFIQNPDHSFDDVSKAWGVDHLNPSGTVYLDINKDGRLDLVSGQTSTRMPNKPKRLFVLKNVQPYAGKRSLSIHLRGIEANSKGIGARVVLKTNFGRKQSWHQPSQGSLPSQNQNIVFFGLDKNESPLSLEVFWPLIKDGQVHSTFHPLKQLKFQKFLELTLCDNGRMYIGNKNQCPSKT